MNGPLTHEELAALMKSCAGVTADPEQLRRPDATFDEFGLDSLGLLGIVSELERRYQFPLGADVDQCKTPHEFLETTNSQLTSGV
ncbi:curamycin polyketide synthase [Embleya scabrispora]|uniref:Curamycin polyketide synthase n=1 Tax=Embleya scabrispora TaxID=159449 RepID=A0A1T3NNS3_9ACTN|nr:acyl carrier protein [Embleya scabrispora]OPC78382.1 curamycin polyketide synthase [Embleya scabrispora]